MQLALYGSIAWRHPLGIGQVIQWAQQYGWDFVDARGLTIGAPGDAHRNLNAFGYDMLGPQQIRDSARRELRARLDDAGVPLLCIYCPHSVNLPGETGAHHRRRFTDFLQLAADLGAPWVRSINNTLQTHQGPEMTADEAYERTVAGTRDVGRRAAELGVGIMLENNENTVTPNAESLAQLKSDAGDAVRIGIAYDAVNAYFQGHDPASGFDILQGQIDVLHAKNVRRHSEARWDYMPRGDAAYEWTSLADGDLDWRALLRKAHAGGFDGPLTYEYVNPFKGMPLSYWDTLAEPHEAAQSEGKYLRGLLTQCAAPETE